MEGETIDYQVACTYVRSACLLWLMLFLKMASAQLGFCGINIATGSR